MIGFSFEMFVENVLCLFVVVNFRVFILLFNVLSGVKV